MRDDIVAKFLLIVDGITINFKGSNFVERDLAIGVINKHLMRVFGTLDDLENVSNGEPVDAIDMIDFPDYYDIVKNGEFKSLQLEIVSNC